MTSSVVHTYILILLMTFSNWPIYPCYFRLGELDILLVQDSLQSECRFVAKQTVSNYWATYLAKT